MIIVMKPNATDSSIEKVVEKLEEKGFRVHISEGVTQTVIGAIGDDNSLKDPSDLEVLEEVQEVVRISEPFRLSNRAFHPENSIVKVVLKNDEKIEIGGKTVHVMAGPCSVETEEQMFKVAEGISKAGAKILRGGAFKPRTSPYDFQGLGVEGLKIMKSAADKYNLAVITELVDIADIDVVCQYSDIIQIGARNMYNYRLLAALGKINKPVLLKRGLSALIQELLMASEYILSNGNKNVILCERGIRTYETATRNTFDINAIPVLKIKSHLPVCADPSHGTGKRDLVAPVARAAVAAGADCLMIETHPDPDNAQSDAAQTLGLEQFAKLMDELRIIASAIGKKV